MGFDCNCTNGDTGGIAPDAVVWSAGSLLMNRRTLHAVRELAMILDPGYLWGSQWIRGTSERH